MVVVDDPQIFINDPDVQLAMRTAIAEMVDSETEAVTVVTTLARRRLAAAAEEQRRLQGVVTVDTTTPVEDTPQAMQTATAEMADVQTEAVTVVMTVAQFCLAASAEEQRRLQGVVTAGSTIAVESAHQAEQVAHTVTTIQTDVAGIRIQEQMTTIGLVFDLSGPRAAPRLPMWTQAAWPVLCRCLPRQLLHRGRVAGDQALLRSNHASKLAIVGAC